MAAQTTEKSENPLPTMREPIQVRRLPVQLHGDDRRVIARPFILGTQRIRTLFSRLAKLSEEQVHTLLKQVEASYNNRHGHLLKLFAEHYHGGAAMIAFSNGWTNERKLLAGAYLTMEYAVDSAALFNPSIVPHPKQENIAPGALRILMSLRATGEGHVSSIVFRTGSISAAGDMELDPQPQHLHRSRLSPDRQYIKWLFLRKLKEMGLAVATAESVLSGVPEKFELGALVSAVDAARPKYAGNIEAAEVLRTMLWLASSNYHVDLAPNTDLGDLVIFPMNDEESHGIEDLRMVRFVDDDKSVTYFGTYTAYNGVRTLPMLMSTSDFRRIEFASLNGNAALNKGMALFPRKIKGRYVMCSRIDGENLFISTSEAVHFWNTAQRLAAPRLPWELMQIGNCGSPIETDKGWLLLTHGVGPMRTYVIGAMLLDLEDPLKVIGHLEQPLLAPLDSEREGYVPNVVYTCGSLAHAGKLYIPYAQADKSTSISVVDLNELLDRLAA